MGKPLKLNTDDIFLYFQTYQNKIATHFGPVPCPVRHAPPPLLLPQENKGKFAWELATLPVVRPADFLAPLIISETATIMPPRRPLHKSAIASPTAPRKPSALSSLPNIPRQYNFGTCKKPL
jgi:hypothetical protein